MIENLKCPACFGPMTSRVNRSTGQRFWGCNAYPKCRGTRDTDGEAPQRTTRADQVDDESDLPSERARRHDDGRWRQR
jgi:ssDNA-binding Zn-finger/Zn-ribbon topoisomerase 1